jgi:hypothetical protein
MALVLVSALAIMGAGCDGNPTTVSLEDLASPPGLTSVTGDGAVVLRRQASNFGEDRGGFYLYQSSGTQPVTPGESIPGVLGTAALATLTTTQGSGFFTTTVGGQVNGATYSFLVVAFKDGGGKLSRPSNVISDTSRREFATLDLTNSTGNSLGPCQLPIAISIVPGSSVA